MATKTGKTPASYYKNDLTIDQSTNTGIDSTTRKVHDGAGQSTAISLSDDSLAVQPTNDDTTDAFAVSSKARDSILTVDTTNSLVKVGVSQVNATTQFKEMGLYEFSPGSAGNHYPLIANRVGMQGAEQLTADTGNDWGDGTDPATSLDVSGLDDPENAIAIYWYLENNITLDAVRFMVTCDGGAESFSFHLLSYDLDVSTNHGDLSNGVVNASASVSSFVSAFTIKTGTLTLDTADIDAKKVVVGFAENATSADDFSVHFNIKYHVR